MGKVEAGGASAWKSRQLFLAGPAAAALFAASVIGFAAIRQDDYSHATKAVSELGATGAPQAVWFNFTGFILPGLLILILAMGLYLHAGRRASGPVLLALSGLAFAATGIFPVDMADRDSATSQVHLLAAMLCGILWGLSLFPIGSALRAAGHRAWGRLTPWFGLALVANLAWQVQWQAYGWLLPGWGQRIGFAGLMIWSAGTGLLLWHARGSQRSTDGRPR